MIDGCDDHDGDYCVFDNYVSFNYVHDYFNSNDDNDNKITFIMTMTTMMRR